MQVGERAAMSAFLRSHPDVLEHEMRSEGLELSDTAARHMVRMAYDGAVGRAAEQARRDREFRAAESRAKRGGR